MKTYTIKNKFYGKRFLNKAVFYEGFRAKPKLLKDKGQGFPGGKHLLETIAAKYKSFRLILTRKTDRISRSGSRADVRISEGTMKRFDAIVREKRREMNLDAISAVLATTFPEQFRSGARVESYRKGMLAKLLRDDLDPRTLSMEDVRAITGFAARVAADPKAKGMDEREIVGRKRDVQLIYLRKLIVEYEDRLKKVLSESDWQQYFSEKILYFQDSYIRKVEKMNVATVTTQFPDFGVITADDFLDVIEIKLPSTPILKEDPSHNSFYWSADIAKAIAQVESYIESITNRRADLTLQIEKVLGLKLRIVKPRGMVIAGSSREWDGDPRRLEYFRMLNEGLKNVEIVPYDELARRLRNTMTSIENLEAGPKGKGAGKTKRAKKRT